MKKHLIVATLFFICISLFSSHSFSQTITADTTLANQYFDLARKLENDSKIDSAILYVGKAQALNIKYFGEKSLKNAKFLHSMGQLCWLNNKYELALEYDFKSLQIRKEILGEKNTYVAASYYNIGIVYFFKGEIGRAHV